MLITGLTEAPALVQPHNVAPFIVTLADSDLQGRGGHGFDVCQLDVEKENGELGRFFISVRLNAQERPEIVVVAMKSNTETKATAVASWKKQKVLSIQETA